MDTTNVIIGVSGGIAAYKMCAVIRDFAQTQNTNVEVIPTESALQFVGKATFEALSHNKVATSVFDDVHEVRHILMGKNADLIIVAPATADILAQLASGMTHSLLTATVLTARCPVVIFPAMHTEMYEHPATQRNISILREYGYYVVEPAVGRLTGEDSGIGRLPEPEEIVHLSKVILEKNDALSYDFSGTRMLISAGGTREPLDPVRYITNRSSGKQGYALASVARARGAEVTLVTSSYQLLPPPAGVEIVPVNTARDMDTSMAKCAADKDVIIMAAAVADFRPTTVSATKVKKSTKALHSLDFEENPDILMNLVSAKELTQDSDKKPIIVGFAAETGDENHSVLDYAQMKLQKKGCDLLVVNPVGNGKAFEVDDNSGWILDKNLREQKVKWGSKYHMSSEILDRVRDYIQ